MGAIFMGDDVVLEQILNGTDIYLFAKDRKGKYIFANDNLACAAGMDSKEQMIGKTDYDLIWRDQADVFRQGDKRTLDGNPHIKIPEVQIQPDGIKEIITSKNILYTHNDTAVGIIGYYIESTGKVLIDKIGIYDPVKKRIYLGSTFNSEYLTRREIQVFYYVLLGLSARKIADRLFRSKKTIEYHIDRIKNKLQCNTRGDMIAIAIKSGLTYTIFNTFMEGDREY
jgi:DNA-binding CsgD family transcriptional regulator